MMNYIIIPLRFTAPVHFGDATQGGGLREVEFLCRADRLYSALCVEALRKSEAQFEDWIRKTQDGSIIISDLLPWHENEGAYEWYVPKPVMEASPQEERKETLAQARKSSVDRKKSKKRSFVRAAELALYVDNLRGNSSSLSEEPDFGAGGLETHFNGRTAMPYMVAGFSFSENAGLYLLLGVEDPADAETVRDLLSWTGLSGIGGRRSSGMGKFEVGESVVLTQEAASKNPDLAALFAMLSDEASDTQMAIAGFLPQKEEAEIAAKGRGLWTKRSGFTWSEGMESPVKEKNIYMMTSGSTFPKRLKGRIADVGVPAVGHPVYRYGKGFFLGVPK